MDRRERERIMGEHQPRGPSERERREAEQLAADLEGSPVAGKPLPRRLRNFSPSVEGYALSVAGPPAYAQRLRQIEDEIDDHLARLQAAWEELCREVPAADERERRWRELAGRWSFHAVNDLIERHNRWYPVEARLAMSPRTGDFVPVGGRSYRLEPLDAAWVLVPLPARGTASGLRRSRGSDGTRRLSRTAHWSEACARRKLTHGVEVAPAASRASGAVRGRGRPRHTPALSDRRLRPLLPGGRTACPGTPRGRGRARVGRRLGRVGSPLRLIPGERSTRRPRRAASCPQAASMSRPRVRRTVVGRRARSSTALNAAIASREEPSNAPVGL